MRVWAKLWYWFRPAGAARLPMARTGAGAAAGVAAYGSVAPMYPLMLVSGSKRAFALG